MYIKYLKRILPLKKKKLKSMYSKDKICKILEGYIKDLKYFLKL